MNLRAQLERLPHNPEWLGRYLRFIDESAQPRTGQCHRHHILPKSKFPEFQSFEKHPWNRKLLSPADHFFAHYLLFRTLPRVPQAVTGFFWMVVKALAGSDCDESLIRGIADRFQKGCESGVTFPWEPKPPVDIAEIEEALKKEGHRVD